MFLLRIPVPWMFILTYLAGVAIGLALPLHILPANPVAGSIVFALGALIAAWGWITFRIARTTTVPGRASSQMVTWGPYRFTRNPMYIGLTVAYLGEGLILGHFWSLALLPLVWSYVNWIVIPVEEAKLREVFGDTYDQYRGSVRRWM